MLSGGPTQIAPPQGRCSRLAVSNQSAREPPAPTRPKRRDRRSSRRRARRPARTGGRSRACRTARRGRAAGEPLAHSPGPDRWRRSADWCGEPTPASAAIAAAQVHAIAFADPGPLEDFSGSDGIRRIVFGRRHGMVGANAVRRRRSRYRQSSRSRRRRCSRTAGHWPPPNRRPCLPLRPTTSGCDSKYRRWRLFPDRRRSLGPRRRSSAAASPSKTGVVHAVELMRTSGGRKSSGIGGGGAASNATAVSQAGAQAISPVACCLCDRPFLFRSPVAVAASRPTCRRWR